MTETKMQLEDWLDDLCVRFIINLPEEDLSSVPRICFQVEEAQWFYEDFVRPQDPTLPSMSLRSFCLRIFAHCPLLSAFSQGDHMRAFEDFLLYKTRVPVRGVILLNEAMDSAVLVKGWKKGANWSFPRGKINKDEDDLACAIREAYEETGYDLEAAGLVPKNRDVKYIEINMREQQMRLYVFRNVPMDTHFEPKTRKEISKIQWWRLSELPAFRKKGHQQPEAAMNANKFYMVAPFLVPLKKWVVEQKKKDAKLAASGQHLLSGFSQDEALTEEDQKPEPKSYLPPTHAAREIDTLEGATAALSRLLKIQPPTQGIQAEALTAVQSPASKNSGEALLALLQGNPATKIQEPTKITPQTPSNHTILQPPAPETPRHLHQHHPALSSLPPTFQAQPSIDSYSYPTLQNHPGQSSHTVAIQQRTESVPNQPSFTNTYAYQSQHLLHPQPLPPQVQRTLFTDGISQSRTAPQAMQQQASLLSSISNPQFPGLHAPMVSRETRAPQPKLTSHSLALLNAFKSRGPTNANQDSAVESSHPYSDQNAQSNRPHELSTDMQVPGSAAIASQSVPAQYPVDAMNFGPLASRPLVSDAHRSNLLGLFKSPKSQAAAVPLPQASPSVSTSLQTAAVELSASELPSSVIASQKTAKNKEVEKEYMRPIAVTPDSEVTTDSRPITILPRPSQTSTQTTLSSNNQRSKVQTWETEHLATRKPQTPVSEKPFQPQILKRPTQTTAPSGTTIQSMGSSSMNIPHIQPLLDRHISQTDEHKKTLLSLFARSPSATSASSLLGDSAQQTNAQPLLVNEERPMSNLGDLSLAGNEGITLPRARKESHTQISSADQGFLLNYLDAVAKDSLR
ncbi:Dcp2, box A domain-containing protein [Xylogone sp. PMI_703]|nr:Dcp2, box A domain-containing protein [Xylogone sp. PMI_703]